jgi:citrate lyase beta subunit
MPGDSLRKINKATQIGVDTVIMDLEDGVALNRKEEARRTVAEALQTLDFGSIERLVRVNPPDSEAFAADLRVTLAARPDGYVIPKVETAEQVQVLSHHLAKTEYLHDWPSGSIRLLAMIETARGVMNLKEIAQASQRLEALIFGAEDLAGDIGARRTRAGWEVFYARSAVVTAAAAYGLQALDMIFADLNDLEGLEEECVFARQLGYDGKTAIHPRQIEVINRTFAPSAAEIEQARRIVEANEAHQASGVGAFDLDGRMVDMPIVRAAEQVLAKARLVGLID